MKEKKAVEKPKDLRWFVTYIGEKDNLLGYKPPSGSGRVFSFGRNRPVEVDDELDLNWFKFKAEKNPMDWKVFQGAPDGVPVEQAMPKGHETESLAQKKLEDVREYFRQLRGVNLSPELKKVKGILEGGN